MFQVRGGTVFYNLMVWRLSRPLTDNTEEIRIIHGACIFISPEMGMVKEVAETWYELSEHCHKRDGKL